MASWPPKKNAAFTLYAPILDADGDPVAAAAGLSSVLIQDGGAGVAGPVPVDEGEGVYSVALTAAQMNFDAVVVIIKTTTTGAKTTILTLYTVTRQLDDLAFPVVSGSGIDVAGGGVEVGTFQAGAITAAAFGAGAIDGAAIATDAIGAAEFSQGAADKVWNSATRTLTAFSTALGVSVWDVLETAVLVASSMGLKVKNNLDVVLSTRATPAQVNTEVLDVLNTDTFGEPGQAAPPASTTLATKIAYLYKFLRNRITQTSTTLSVYGDDGITVDQKATVSDDGTTFDRTEIVSGP